MMAALAEHPTRTVGLIAYSVSLAACVVTLAQARAPSGRRRLAAILALLNVLLLLDMRWNTRWWLHDRIDGALSARGLYGARLGVQLFALLVLAAAAAAGVGMVLGRVRGGGGARLAAAGGVLSLSCWFLEVVSLHAVDHLLYQSVAGVKRVSLLWIACAAMTSAGLLWDAARGQSGNWIRGRSRAGETA